MAAAAARTGGAAAGAAASAYGHDSDDEKYASPDGSQAGHTDGGGDDHGDNETLATAGVTLGGMSTTTTGGTRKVNVNNVPFSLVCALMNRVLMSKRLQKERLMIQFWKSVFQPHVSLYPLMRLLLPQLDSERSTYGLRESSLGDVYIAALGLSKTLDQAMRLKSYKSPHRGAGGGAAGAHTSVGSVSGDFTLVLVDVLRKYISVAENSSKLTVADVNAMLDSLAQDRERGSSARQAIFTRAVTEMSPSENMWFCRIILKDLKMGMKHESMLKLFDSDALDIYNACSSLKTVCEHVAQPGRVKAVFSAVEYFSACKPMLASCPPWNSVVSKMRGHRFFVEDKFDGERLLLHKKGDQVKMFTRKSVDYTERYSYGATFTPVVLAALQGHDCIVDGEMVAYDTATGLFLKFGSNRTIALAGAGALGDTKQLCYVAFDILKLDDQVLLDTPLRQRRDLLLKLVRPQAKKFEVIKHRTDVTNSQGLLDALTTATGAGKEGVIVKDETSPYILNDRSDWWIKVKPDYIDGLRDNMDLILMGGYYGEGTRRSGGISHFLLGLHEKKLTPSDLDYYRDRKKLPPRLFAFCKVGSGYSIERLKELRKDLESKWQVYDKEHQPPHFMGWAHERSDQPDVWIDPRDSVTFEIKAYEITACRPNKFSAGYTCRFPRVVQIRDDKEWSDCMTRDDMLKLAEPAVRQSAGALLASEAGAAAVGGGGGAARLLYDDDNAMGLDALLEEQERDIKQERDAAGEGEWGAPDADESDRTRRALDLASSPPPLQGGGAAHPLFGVDAHMQGDGAGGVEVGALYAEGDGALDWRQGDAHAGFEGDGMGAAAAAAAAAMDAGGSKKGKKRKAKDDSKKVVIKKGSVPSLFRPTDVSNVVLVSNIFENKCFCVMSTDKTPDKAELERTIALHGGTFTQNPLPHTFCILAKWEDTIKVAVQRKAKNKDIIHYSWLQDCVTHGRLLPFSSRYVIQGTDATIAALSREVDPFSDPYTLDTDREALEGALAEVAAKQPHPFDGAAEVAAGERVNRTIMAQATIPTTLQLHRAKSPPDGYRSQFLSFTLAQQESLSSPVRAFIGYEVFVFGKQDSTKARLCVLTLRLLGARLTSVLSANVTHVLHLPSADPSFTLDALRVCIESVGLHLDTSPPSEAASAAPARSSSNAGTCQLITPDWVEQQRQLQTDQLHRTTYEEDDAHLPMEE